MNEIVFNKGMKVFSKLFVGIKNNVGDYVPLAFATPYEENAAGKKRQETVMSWLGGEYVNVVENGQYVYENGHPKRKKVERNTKIFDNVPRSGFKITDDVKRVYWGGGNVVWRVFDPYGYELEIQSNNLMALIQSCGVEVGGLIPGNCVWGRDGGVNILLHESSEEYKNAIKAAETLKPNKKIPMKDRIVGGKYTLQTGEQGIYLGKVWVWVESNHKTFGPNKIYKTKVYTSDDFIFNIKEPEQYEAMLFEPFSPEGKGRIIFYKSASLVRYDNVTLDIQDSCFKESSLRFPSRYESIKYTSRDKPEAVRYTTESISEEDLNSALERNKHLRFASGESYSADSIRLFSSSTVVLKHEDKLYGGYGGNYYNSIDPHLLSCVVLNGDKYTLNSLTSAYHYGAYHPARATQSIVSDSVFELPKFSTAEELSNWCTSQFKAGNLVKIVVESC